ncbi:MAG: glycosyltransferase family 2 protein, partial [Solirubrobacterales bacterium]|nr:glycosyltransferase family 2 protein [Solirubrobacterales bacterium]
AARGHIQSLIAGAVLFIAAMLLVSLGVIGDLLDAQRTLSQRTFERVRRIELQLGVEPSHYEPGAPAHRPGTPSVSETPPAPDRRALEV